MNCGCVALMQRGAPLPCHWLGYHGEMGDRVQGLLCHSSCLQSVVCVGMCVCVCVCVVPRGVDHHIIRSCQYTCKWKVKLVINIYCHIYFLHCNV